MAIKTKKTGIPIYVGTSLRSQTHVRTRKKKKCPLLSSMLVYFVFVVRVFCLRVGMICFFVFVYVQFVVNLCISWFVSSCRIYVHVDQKTGFLTFVF